MMKNSWLKWRFFGLHAEMVGNDAVESEERISVLERYFDGFISQKIDAGPWQWNFAESRKAH